MWEIIENSVNYTTGDVGELYAIIAVVAFSIAIFMYKTACSKDD